MKILLISPNMLINKAYQPKDASFPLGLGYLASVALCNGHNVQMIDSYLEGVNQHRSFNKSFNEWGLSDDQIVERVINIHPDTIGIGCTFTTRWPIVKRLSTNIKKKLPNVLIATGGIHPSNSPEEVLHEKSIDFICIGEGELVFEQLLESIEKGSNFSNILGLGFKKNGKCYINEERNFIRDLNKIPFPARHLLPYKQYIKYNRNSVIATRGCPYKCTFCSMPTVMGRSFRSRSAKNFVDEIEYIQKTYKTIFFSFDDDNLTLLNTFVSEFCDEIIKRGLKIYWNTPNGVNINSLTLDLLKKMKLAGCYSINLAIESGDEKILEIMKKIIPLEKVRKITEWCRELHIFTLGYFVIGMPGETFDSMEKSKQFALSLPIDAINVFIATPFPGTPFFKECLEKGYINNYSYDRLNTHEASINTDFLSAENVKKYQVHFLNEFAKSKKEPFTHDLLNKVVRNPESEEFLKDYQYRYFEIG